MFTLDLLATLLHIREREKIINKGHVKVIMFYIEGQHVSGLVFVISSPGSVYWGINGFYSRACHVGKIVVFLTLPVLFVSTQNHTFAVE